MTKRKFKPQIVTESDKKAVRDGCRFDHEAGEHPCKFINRLLIHPNGPVKIVGQPYQIIPWQANELLRPLFGWKRKNGRRRFTDLFLEVPKKNNKTEMAGAIVNYLMFGEGKSGKEIYSAASERDQAAMVFNDARKLMSPDLKERARFREHKNQIFFDERGNSFMSLAAEKDSAEGKRIYALIFDELHVQKKRDFFEALEYANVAERSFDEPLNCILTTAGIYDLASIGWEKHRYAESVLSGDIEDTGLLAIVYSVAEEDQWDDPKILAAANPSVGYTIALEELITSAKKASFTPAAEANFRRYRCNQWLSAVNRCLPAGIWSSLKIPEPDLEGWTCHAGLDVGMRRDLSAFALYFRPRATAEKAGALPFVKTWFWMPRESLNKPEIVEVTQYAGWVREGFIKALPGEFANYAMIAADIEEISKKYPIKFVGYDNWNADNIAVALENCRFEMIDVPQTTRKLHEPLADLVSMVVEKRITHDGNPVMTWMSGNLESIEDSNGYCRPKKEHKDSKKRIDGFSALVDALAVTKHKTPQYIHSGMG